MVFFHFVQGVRVQKSLMPRGSAAQGFVVYYDIFSLFFPAISDPDAQRECHFEDQREWEGT